MAALATVRAVGRSPIILNLKSANGVTSVSVLSNKSRFFSTSPKNDADKNYKLLVVGGGAAGSSIANTFTSTLGKGQVAVLEPSLSHYYQPMWTLVGGGLKEFSQSEKSTKWVLPDDCDWLIDSVSKFDPQSNSVTTEKGDKITYEYMVVSVGIALRYDMVKGLPEALENDPRVCSNYSHIYVKKTWPALQAFEGGDAYFTFPNTPIKCAGAPQKIAYLADDYLRRNGKRESANLIYKTSLPAIFGIPRYAKALQQICDERHIAVDKRQHLVEVDHAKSEATFEYIDEKRTETVKYDFLHAAPPCSPYPIMMGSPISDAGGWVDVNRGTMQHNKFPNVFGMGDCTNAPTAKTAAAVASQSGAVARNLTLVMNGKSLEGVPAYDGYTSCPLTVTKDKVMLAEFGYDGSILETFPIDQSKPSVFAGMLKKYFFPSLYFHAGVKGLWTGPEWFRNVFKSLPYFRGGMLK